ncbi:MAG: hypothetical protein WEB52_08930 [Dehalococcoidia bacterium]
MSEAAAKTGHIASRLAGLHVYFFVATALQAQPCDLGCFITSSEWLDVAYGKVVRNLLTNGLGLQAIHLIDRHTMPFEDAQTTGAIVCFEVTSDRGGVSVSLGSRKVAGPQIGSGRTIALDSLIHAERWTPALLDRTPHAEGLQSLGEIARVHRGIATGANGFFVISRQEAKLFGIERWCVPVVSDGREILQSNFEIRDGEERKVLVVFPRDVDRASHPEVDQYLRMGEEEILDGLPISQRYLCTHRRSWWNLGTIRRPPIVASYMARQPPRFALNPDRLGIINVAHGLYPGEDLPQERLQLLVRSLNGSRASFTGMGRTYQGGLEKFEPREMEALRFKWVTDG